MVRFVGREGESVGGPRLGRSEEPMVASHRRIERHTGSTERFLDPIEEATSLGFLAPHLREALQ